jgi:hypothetical protein
MRRRNTSGANKRCKEISIHELRVHLRQQPSGKNGASSSSKIGQKVFKPPIPNPTRSHIFLLMIIHAGVSSTL